MEKKYKLELVGITYNQIESGVYAVILQQAGGTRRIPIIIGQSEAQSIECQLQQIVTPRPLTHDLTVNIWRAFGIGLKEVILKQMPNGVFAADLYLTDGERSVVIDSRSSDAIALAIRVGAPIYTGEKVLLEAGFERDASRSKQTAPQKEVPGEAPGQMADMSDEEIEQAMQEAAEREDYEEAARLKAVMENRKKEP